jgi:hypothetical protein
MRGEKGEINISNSPGLVHLGTTSSLSVSRADVLCGRTINNCSTVQGYKTISYFNINHITHRRIIILYDFY